VLEVISFFEKKVNSISEHDDPSEFFREFKSIGRTVEQADPMSFYVGNVVKRMLFMIRREAENLKIEIEKEDLIGKSIKFEKDAKLSVNVQAVFKDDKDSLTSEEMKQEKLSSITEVDESEDASEN